MEITKRPPEFGFSPVTDDALSDYDAVMSYEVFLGRHPENAETINYHKSLGVSGMLARFMNGEEFADKVITPLRTGKPLWRGDRRHKPAENVVAWVVECAALSAEEAVNLAAAANWTEFYRVLLAARGVAAGTDVFASVASNEPTDDIGAILTKLQRAQALLAEIAEEVETLRAASGA